MAAPWFKLYPKEIFGKEETALLSHEEFGILVRLWALASQEGSIPADPSKLAKLLRGLTEKQMLKQMVMVGTFFKPLEDDPSRLYSRRLQEEQQAYEEKVQKLKQSGSKGGLKTQANAQANASPGDKQKLEQKPPEVGSRKLEVEKDLPPLAPQGAPSPSAQEAEKPKRKKRTRDPLPLNRLGGTALEAFEEARACWPLEIHGWNERIRGNETRKIAIGNIPQAQKFFLQLIEEGHATAQELYACAWVAVEEWKRTGYLWVPHLSTFFGPEKETWAQFLPKAKQALQTFQEVG